VRSLSSLIDICIVSRTKENGMHLICRVAWVADEDEALLESWLR